MTVVVDASVIVAALIDTSAHGTWAEDLVGADGLVAPHLLAVETAQVLRRAAASGAVSDDVATLAHADLVDLDARIQHASYAPFAPRIWELRQNVSAYDAWYVAVAEALSAPLATLDRRLAHAPGARCEFLLGPGA